MLTTLKKKKLKNINLLSSQNTSSLAGNDLTNPGVPN